MSNSTLLIIILTIIAAVMIIGPRYSARHKDQVKRWLDYLEKDHSRGPEEK